MDKLSPFHDKQIEKALIFGRLKKHVLILFAFVAPISHRSPSYKKKGEKF